MKAEFNFLHFISGWKREKVCELGRQTPSWKSRGGSARYRFIAECKRSTTPKDILAAIAQLRRYAHQPEYYPMLIVPYLSGERLAELEAQGVSGIDLCGNGLVVIPDELLVYHTGCPNTFRSEAAIKNVFRGDSSLVGRSFFIVPEYGSVQEVCREIEKRGGSVALSTVSKVCKGLEAVLVIERKRERGSAARQLRLLQPDKLLDLLAANYIPPPTTRAMSGKMKLSPDALDDALDRVERGGARVVQTGFGSVASYAVMAKEPVRYFYCSDLDLLVRELGGAFESDRPLRECQFHRDQGRQPFTLIGVPVSWHRRCKLTWNSRLVTNAPVKRPSRCAAPSWSNSATRE